MSTTNLVVESTSFLTSNLDLRPVQKTLKGVSKQAIAVLEMQLNSSDEKIAQTAATKLLDYYIQVSKDLNTDQIQRLIADIKYNQQKRLVPEGEGIPTIDFSNIQQDI